jgi:hypothetical protein
MWMNSLNLENGDGDTLVVTDLYFDLSTALPVLRLMDRIEPGEAERGGGGASSYPPMVSSFASLETEFLFPSLFRENVTIGASC